MMLAEKEKLKKEEGSLMASLEWDRNEKKKCVVEM